ncbi:inorganic phosphate transporter [Desulforhopalus singaporensis]|uniref:Phosphate transporter n=1 Tax=Desulforhopalus singaporensis TaxID=91360 RepID=A0A1H0RVT0_9BACT|nr:inorganic phosphate transporter [Desulforhopalus singaporensis]SDP33584.1 inorganic phosphate transporter, PiT family [Desulforhopalus singaporensis]
MTPFFLSSGLFLGWSLGANDASNVFGTAVGSRMIRFRTAAVSCSIFVILGAVISGAGATETLSDLGAVNAMAGSFVVAFAAAVSVYLMTLAKWPVSTSQAIVGSIVGWNLFSGFATDYNALTKIVLTWVACPLLSAAIAVICYKCVQVLVNSFSFHIFMLDRFTRAGLLLAGAFGSYSLGANNIANVVGVFLPGSFFDDLVVFDTLVFSARHQLFLIGSIAIAVGVFTYSRRVIETVGRGIFKLSPIMAFVAVLSHSIVLFLFASQGIESFLLAHGLPPIPLVPVSSSQAIVGAVLGMGLMRGGRNINWKKVSGIAVGWVCTPVIAGIVCFICLFFAQNVFQQIVFHRDLPIASIAQPPHVARNIVPDTRWFAENSNRGRFQGDSTFAIVYGL